MFIWTPGPFKGNNLRGAMSGLTSVAAGCFLRLRFPNIFPACVETGTSSVHFKSTIRGPG